MVRRLLSPRSRLSEVSDAPPGIQSLPLTVRPVRSLAELREVSLLRESAYGRHFGLTDSCGPEEFDFAPNALVLAAIEKRTSKVIGTLRVMIGDTGPLQLDTYVRLPRERIGVAGEASRLAVARTRLHTLAKLSLWKAFHRLCSGYGVDSMVLAARSPLDHDYLWLDFENIGREPLWFVPGGSFCEPHRVLMQRMSGLQERWRGKGHDFYKFNFELVHPDIRPFVDGGTNPLSALSRMSSIPSTANMAVDTRRAWPRELANWAPV